MSGQGVTSLLPDPWLAERLLLRWCPLGKPVQVAVANGSRSAVHVYTLLPGTSTMLPISVQVADVLGRYLDPAGAVDLKRGEKPSDLVKSLSKRLHGREDALVLPVVPTAPVRRRRRLSL